MLITSSHAHNRLTLVDWQREEVITQEALHSPSTLLDEEEQLLVEELLVEEDQSLSAEAFTTEMEPSIEMAEDLKEPGNDDGGVDDSGTEINTSIGDVDQQEELAQEHQQSTEADLSIQEPQSTEADQTVASGSECRPVEAGDLSGSSSNNREIQQENIKHALHEIISEIDREMEADFSNEEVSHSSILYAQLVNVWCRWGKQLPNLFMSVALLFSPAPDVQGMRRPVRFSSLSKPSVVFVRMKHSPCWLSCVSMLNRRKKEKKHVIITFFFSNLFS